MIPKTDPFAQSATDQPPKTDPSPMTDPTPMAEPKTPAAEAFGLVNSSVVTPAELGSALKEADDARKAMGGIDTKDPKFPGLNRAYFMKAYDLAEKVTHIKKDGADFTLHQKLEAVNKTIAPNGAETADIDSIGRTASIWIPNANRKVAGIVIAGTVQSVIAHDKFVETKIQLAGDADPARFKKDYIVISPTKLAGVKENAPAIILGVIVDQPATNIHGYAGTDDRVIWSTYAIDFGGSSADAAPAASAAPSTPATPSDAGGNEKSPLDDFKIEPPKTDFPIPSPPKSE
jgi:hypothetical protein